MLYTHAGCVRGMAFWFCNGVVLVLIAGHDGRVGESVPLLFFGDNITCSFARLPCESFPLNGNKLSARVAAAGVVFSLPRRWRRRVCNNHSNSNSCWYRS